MKRIEFGFRRYWFSNAWAAGVRIGPWELWIELSKPSVRTSAKQEEAK